MPVEANDVLNYLEIIGVLVCDARIARRDEAWAAYYAYVVTWFAIRRPAILRFRESEDDLTIRSSVGRLYETLARCDVDKRTAAAKGALRTQARAFRRRARSLRCDQRIAAKSEAARLRRAARDYAPRVTEPNFDDLRSLLEGEATLPNDLEPIQAAATLDPRTSIEVRVR